MAGTLIVYQGLRGTEVTFRRTRGYRPDVSDILVPMDEFLGRFTLVPPRPPVWAASDPSIPDLEAIRGAGGIPAVPERVSLEAAGTLCMAEVQDRDWQVIVHPLYVQRVDEVKRADSGLRSMVRIRLVDERVFWRERGFLRRWSYNRPRARGGLAKDSLKPDGGTYSLDEVALDVTNALPRSPRLVYWPASWTSVKGHMHFTRHAPAHVALAELQRIGRSEEPCLRLDGTLAFHIAGDGMVGFAPSGKGPNAEKIPPETIVSLNGTGRRLTLEPTYDPDYVVVVGGITIRTEAIDDWEPVLVLPDDGAGGPPRRVVPLNDETLARYTGGKVTMKTLSALVLMPRMFQNVPGLSEVWIELLREQAWRLWRLPKAVKAKAKDDLSEDDEPGENAHLLPLLARAEDVGGRRMPVTVETYRFATQHLKFFSSTSILATNAQATMARVKETVAKTSLASVKQNPFDQQAWNFATNAYLTPSKLLQDIAGSLPENVPTETLNGYITTLRQLEQVTQAGYGPAASAYEAAMAEEAKGLDELDGGARSEALAIAKKAVQLEKDIRERSSATGSLGSGPAAQVARAALFYDNVSVIFRSPEGELLREAFKTEVQADLRAASLKQTDAVFKRVRTGTGTAGAVKASTIGFLRNRPDRTPDRGARVFSAELGIVQVSELPGWVLPDGTPSEDSTGTFTPKPVRVLFGATRRPATDRSLVDGKSIVRGTLPANLLTSSEGDGQTYFVMAFRRGPDGLPIKIELAEVPVGDGMPIPREDLVELVPLPPHVGNRGELETDAIAAATSAFVRPAQVRAEDITMARPVPVNVDGVVAAVETKSRPGGNGFLTTITTGGASAPDPNPFRTKDRPPRMQQRGDDAAREGLSA